VRLIRLDSSTRRVSVWIKNERADFYLGVIDMLELALEDDCVHVNGLQPGKDILQCCLVHDNTTPAALLLCHSGWQKCLVVVYDGRQ
jgi:hypothetical protein